MSEKEGKAQGSVRILKYRVELFCEARIDDRGEGVPEGERYVVLSSSLTKSGIGTNPKDGLSEADIRLILLNNRALEEMACLTLIERNHRERNPLVIPGKAPRGGLS